MWRGKGELCGWGHALGLFREPFVKVRDTLHPRELQERLYGGRSTQNASEQQYRWEN